jgi:hypothetical protein
MSLLRGFFSLFDLREEAGIKIAIMAVLAIAFYISFYTERACRVLAWLLN